MSKIKKIEVAMGRTIQTKPYESFRVDVTLGAIMDPEDDPDELYDDLVSRIEKKIELEVEKYMP